MTMRTPEQAAGALCPFARTFAASHAVTGCRGEVCMLWRWEAVTTAHPLWRAAVLAEAEKTGEKSPYPKAARHVADNAEALGLVATRGYCGAGAKP